MDRRQALTTIGLGTAGFVVGTGFSAPACGVSKERAVKVASLVIEVTREAIPLADVLGAHDLASLFSGKVIPALEKLRDALKDADIPNSSSLLENVRTVLGSVATALLNLPESPRRTTIMGILTSVNILLLTVEAFIESEVQPTAGTAGLVASTGTSATGEKILKAFEATRQ